MASTVGGFGLTRFVFEEEEPATMNLGLTFKLKGDEGGLFLLRRRFESVRGKEALPGRSKTSCRLREDLVDLEACGLSEGVPKSSKTSFVGT